MLLRVSTFKSKIFEERKNQKNRFRKKNDKVNRKNIFF